MIEIVGKEQLEEFIWENSNEKKIIIIYFGADWCGPCQVLKKKLASHEAKETMPDLVVGYLDIDITENENVSETYSVKSLPTQIFIDLKETQIVEKKRILGFDWTSLVNTYKELDKLRNNEVINVEEQPKGSNCIDYE